MGRKKKTDHSQLTELEHKLMRQMWQLGCATISELVDTWPEVPKPAYTTLATMVKILERKNFLAGEKEGRGFVYVPLVNKASYQQLALKQFLQEHFAGEHLALLDALLDSEELDQMQLNQIRERLVLRGINH